MALPEVVGTFTRRRLLSHYCEHSYLRLLSFLQPGVWRLKSLVLVSRLSNMQGYDPELSVIHTK